MCSYLSIDTNKINLTSCIIVITLKYYVIKLIIDFQLIINIPILYID